MLYHLTPEGATGICWESLESVLNLFSNNLLSLEQVGGLGELNFSQPV